MTGLDLCTPTLGKSYPSRWKRLREGGSENGAGSDKGRNLEA